MKLRMNLIFNLLYNLVCNLLPSPNNAVQTEMIRMSTESCHICIRLKIRIGIKIKMILLWISKFKKSNHLIKNGH